MTVQSELNITASRFKSNVETFFNNLLNWSNELSDSYALFTLDGYEANFYNFTNCFLTSNTRDLFYIDIYPERIEFGGYILNTREEKHIINTDMFITSSDEEIFMQSTVQDFSILNEYQDLLQNLIKISVLANINYSQIKRKQ